MESRSIIKNLYDKIDKIIDKYRKKGADYDNIKNYFKDKVNFKTLLEDISYYGERAFDDKYNDKIKEILNDVIADKKAIEKDNIKTKPMEIKTFEAFLQGDVAIQSVPQATGEPTHNLQIPKMKLIEVLGGVDKASDNCKKMLITFFKTYDTYIDHIDKGQHLFRVNDMSGDILNTNRVAFGVYIFKKNDIETIRQNIINVALSEYYTALPERLVVFGLELNTYSYVDKDALKITFDGAITTESTINIISEMTGYGYEGEHYDYSIWSDRKILK